MYSVCRHSNLQLTVKSESLMEERFLSSYTYIKNFPLPAYYAGDGRVGFYFSANQPSVKAKETSEGNTNKFGIA